MNTDTHDDDRPREHCGLFGLFGVPNAAGLIYNGLFAQQHRGQEGAGIVASDGEKVRSLKGQGLLTEVFSKRSPSELPGNLGIGHVRYSTTGSSTPQNVQPIVFGCIDGIWALAH
ncbi:MAG: amidophosphoribosyltransferase, partial [Kiritimatiellaeota bacterium]|nr:amidophosphoribosyltransferase [Kiritimatiellota bacterium]